MAAADIMARFIVCKTSVLLSEHHQIIKKILVFFLFFIGKDLFYRHKIYFLPKRFYL